MGEFRTIPIIVEMGLLGQIILVDLSENQKNISGEKIKNSSNERWNEIVLKKKHN